MQQQYQTVLWEEYCKNEIIEIICIWRLSEEEARISDAGKYQLDYFLPFIWSVSQIQNFSPNKYSLFLLSQ